MATAATTAAPRTTAAAGHTKTAPEAAGKTPPAQRDAEKRRAQKVALPDAESRLPQTPVPARDAPMRR